MAQVASLHPAHTIRLTTPEQKVFKELEFPLILTPASASSFGNASASTPSSFNEWLKNNHTQLTELCQKHGAILFRDFPIPSAEDFESFVSAFSLGEFPYLGGAAVRTQITPHVFTANESPKELFIPFHHELAQAKDQPGHLFFYCDSAPSEGGQTPIVPSTLVYERMMHAHPELVRTLEQKGVKYVRVLPEDDDPSSAIGRGWKSTFNVKTAAEAEKACENMGMSFAWVDDPTRQDGGKAMKTITSIMPATRKVEGDAEGRVAWFNSIVAAYVGWQDRRNDSRLAILFGDDTPLPEDGIKMMLDIMNDLAVDFKWKKGDALFVDNRVTLHARRAFEG